MKTNGMRIFLYFMTLSLFWPSAFASIDECQTWFERQALKKGEACQIECSIAETDMGTFHCSEQCAELCKKNLKERLYLIFSSVYPTLTQAERELVAKHPKKMLTAYRMRWKAENLCLDIFKESGLNDESDACRHFVWAALLYKSLGLDLSQKILNAHEHNQEQPIEQKSMDLANNRLGLTTATYLKEKNKLNKKEILKSFQKNLKQENLVILEPGAKKASSKPFIGKILDKLKKEEYKKRNNQKETK